MAEPLIPVGATKQQLVQLGYLVRAYASGHLVTGPGVGFRNNCYTISPQQQRGGGRTFVAPKPTLIRITGAGDEAGDYLGVQLAADLTTSAGTPFDGEEGNRPQLREVNRLKGVFATGEVVEAWLGRTDDEPPTSVWYIKSPVGYGQAFTVKLVNDGGDAGDDENDCTLTYTVKDLDGNVLLEEATPERKRYPKTTYIAATEDSYGWACYRIGEGGTPGALVLLDAIEEIEATEACPPPEE